MKFLRSDVLAPTLPASRSLRLKQLSLAAVGVALGTLPASAVTYNYTGLAGDGQYTTSANWLGNDASVAVPNTSNGDTAIINNGSAVSYTPGGDLVIKNGGMLQVTNGSFTQVVGNNYIQLNGNGTVLVNGGTFNQGTDSANPFNITGTGNAFTVTAGTVNLTTGFSIQPGLAFSMSGGTLNATSAGETDFNAPLTTLSGGTFNTTLITGANAPGTSVFSLSGGTLTLSSSRFNGFFGGSSTHYLNFTLGSTAQIIFYASTGATASTVNGFISGGGIELNNATTTPSSFNVTTNAAGDVTISLVAAVPEPSTFAFAALGAAGLAGWMLRRRSRQTV